MKQKLHDIGLRFAILVFPLMPLIKVLVIIFEALILIVLLIIHYFDYIIHFKSYHDRYDKQKKDWEIMLSDYENGLISISIDYPKD